MYDKMIIKHGSTKGKDWYLFIASQNIGGIEFPVIKEFLYGKGLEKLKAIGVQVEDVKTK